MANRKRFSGVRHGAARKKIGGRPNHIERQWFATRLKPPAYLSEAERKLFTEIVDACDPRQFIESDFPLLISFVQATLMVRDTVYVGSKIVLWEKAVRTQIALATKLRLTLTPASAPKVAGRQQYTGPQPWEICCGRSASDDVQPFG